MAQSQVYTDTIAAYFEDSSDARKAVDALQEAGFTSAHLGIAHRGSYTGSNSTVGNSTVYETSENGPSTWDKIKSWFSGEDAEPYADERLQRDPAQQEVVPPSERYDEGYDDTSDLHGSFTAMNIPAERARYFSHRFSRSTHGAVVTVQAGDRKAEAESILNQYNADFGENAGSYDYSSEAGAYQYDGRDRDDRRAGTANAESINSGSINSESVSTERNRDVRERPSNVQLLGEVLRVHKDRVNRGEVRIRKEVVTENQNIQVPVQREELVVDRRPVTDGRPATGTLGEEEIRVPLSEERAKLDKSTVVREEVNVSKKPVEEVRDLSGEVRHEELVVDDETRRKRSA
jgi:uncharacterized protein (TIGR02271 family)